MLRQRQLCRVVQAASDSRGIEEIFAASRAAPPEDLAGHLSMFVGRGWKRTLASEPAIQHAVAHDGAERQQGEAVNHADGYQPGLANSVTAHCCVPLSRPRQAWTVVSTVARVAPRG